MKNKKVVLGMSGGVDSTVAAFLLQKQGYEVIGFFMNCDQKTAKKWHSSIDWKEDERQLKAICARLNIPLHIVDCEEGYERKVISKMFKDYRRGLTPNPDILCNNVGKFPGLYKLAKKLKAQYIATGHYARVKHLENRTELYQGKDVEKDQSYFLLGLPQKILRKCLFPIGELTKEEVRAIAKKNKFDNWDKRSSRGICYLGKIDMKSFLHSRLEEKPGNVLDTKGNVVGKHPGTYFFTIGERVGEKKGVIISPEYKKRTNNSKLYVASKASNKLIVAPQRHPSLRTKKVKLNKFFLVNRSDLPRSGLKARIRHLGELHPGKLAHKNKTWTFTFTTPVVAIAPGQSLALYHKQKLIGGGEIRL